ncbi:MAG: hypothetical protein R3344_10690 [Acidobacteriota bacterium]|nr:hypothetical protein [Acidobacteriota bacterium]
MSISASVRERWGRESPLKRALAVCRRFLYERQTHDLCEADCNVDLPGFDADLAVEIDTVRLEDLSRLAEIAPPGRLKRFRERLERGEICSIAAVRGRIVSYVWITPRDHFDHWFRVTIPVGRDACVGYDAYTHPEFRHRGVRKLLHRDERRRVTAMGRRRLVFWLERGIYERAIDGWEAMGLRQQRIGTIESRHFFRSIVFTTIRYS